MKKLVLVFAILLSVVSEGFTQAMIDNQTNCAVTVTPFCYREEACNIDSYCQPLLVTPNSQRSIPVCECNASIYFTGYLVCWDEPGCTSVCVYVAVPPAICPAYPSTDILPKCIQCVGTGSGNATVQVSPSGDVFIL